MAEPNNAQSAQSSQPSAETVQNNASVNGPSASEASQPSLKASPPSASAPPNASTANNNNNGAPDAAAPVAGGEEKKSQSDSEDDEGDEVLEESPCGRWQKRREQVKQRDVPGIDVAYLAMDNETGTEVVWNEVQFSERKNFRAQEEKIKAVFDNLTKLDHTNLVKFHKYWTDDAKTEKPRVIFITEYMSSGSMSQFLKRTRKGNKTLSPKAWKNWCTQILSALNYLHICDPPIVHGNMSCNSIFIQQNGLIKIGCVAPNAIHHHVKTFRENMKNMHYIAPEYELGTAVTPAADIYSFGICALEMAVLGFSSNGESAAPVVNAELIQKKLDSIELQLQRDFIKSCLCKDPAVRPTSRHLLFHSVLFEVHSLKLLAAHGIVDNKIYETLSEDAMSIKDQDKVIAEIVHPDERPPTIYRYKNVPLFELDKFLEDVKNGVYPLTAFAHPVYSVPAVPTTTTPGPVVQADRAKSPAETGGPSGPSGQVETSTTSAAKPAPSGDAPKQEQALVESRHIVRMSAELKPHDNGQEGFTLTLLLKLEDAMNRQLTAEISKTDTPQALVHELVQHGFIRQDDCESLSALIGNTLASEIVR